MYRIRSCPELVEGSVALPAYAQMDIIPRQTTVCLGRAKGWVLKRDV